MQLTAEILNLTIDKKVALIKEIWDSIEPNKIELSDAQKTELDYRLAQAEKGNTSFVTWDEVKSKLNQYKK